MAEVKDLDTLKAQTKQALQHRDFVAAGPLLEQLLEANPDDPETLGGLAFVRRAMGRTPEALELLGHAVTVEPNHGASRALFVEMLQGEQRFEEALDHLRQLPGFSRDDFQLAAQEADMLGKLGRHDEEIEIYLALIEKNPQLPGLKVSLANALKTIGKTDEAVALLRETTTTSPQHSRAWWMLSDLKSYKFDESEVEQMKQLVGGMGLSPDVIPLHFALAKALEQRGDFEQSFRHYDSGNKLDRTRQLQRVSRVSEITDKAIESFSKQRMTDLAGKGHDSDAPIFIVGLQRSGSTLLEQILASHSKVEGTNELPVMGQIGREILGGAARREGGTVIDRVAELEPEELQRLGRLYIERTAPYRTTDKPHFIDKLPTNWRRIGLIRLILPNAKIIDARRNPMATGWSNYTQYYGAAGDFTRDLEQFGQYYRDYLRLVRHFAGIAPSSIHTVIYEKLVADVESEVRALTDFLGLEFEDSMLEFHRNDRAVRTPSAEQVRQPINRSALDHWRNFEPWLDPLKSALGDDAENWEK